MFADMRPGAGGAENTRMRSDGFRDGWEVRPAEHASREGSRGGGLIV